VAIIAKYRRMARPVEDHRARPRGRLGVGMPPDFQSARRSHRAVGDYLIVPCWCERRTGPLHRAELKVGRTWSCGIGCSRISITRRSVA